MEQASTSLKAKTRKAAFAARRRVHSTDENAAVLVRDHLLASRLHVGAKVVAGYRPIRTEIDPTPLMEAMHRAGHRITVPVIPGEGQPLEFHEWWPGAPMQEGAFGAEVPVDAHVLIPDLLIVPMLAFDRAGWRLGYGGGFYDRTLEGLRARRRITALGLAYDAQEIPEVPVEPTDQRLDAILTPSGITRVTQT